MMTAADLAQFWSSAIEAHCDIFGLGGLFLGFASGTMPRREWILLMAAACSTCFGLHYLNLGAATGAAMCSISVIQGLVSALCPAAWRRLVLAPVFAASGLAAAWLTATTWSGWPSGCAALGALLATGARLQTDPRAMRLCFLAASSIWAGHNWLVGSAFALTCDLLTISGLVLALRRAGRVAPVAAGREGMAA